MDDSNTLETLVMVPGLLYPLEREPAPESQDVANLQGMLEDPTFEGFWPEICESLIELTATVLQA